MSDPVNNPAVLPEPDPGKKPVQKKKRKISKRTVYFILYGSLAVLIIVLALLFRSISEEKHYTSYMEEGRTCFASKQYDEALASLRMAASIDETEECVRLMAECYDGLGNYEKALELLRTLDTSDSAIASRIQEIEAERRDEAAKSYVTVAGTSYPDNTTGIVLDNKNLGNGVLNEVTRLYSLDNLSVAGNGITDISPLSAMGGLSTLNISYNSIYDISPLAGLTNLRTLYLDNNPVTDLSPLYNLTALTTLSIRGIEISAAQLEALSRTLPNCAIHSENAVASVNDITLGGVTFKADVTELDLSGMNIWDISALSGCTKLQTLNLSNNVISDISPLMDIPGLRYLDISDNKVSDLRPLMNMKTVTYLNAAYNRIANTVPINQLTALTTLYLDSNPISNFSGLRQLKNLNYLGLSNTGMKSSDADYLMFMGGLLELDVTENPDLSGEAVANLGRALGACEIVHSELVFTINVDGYEIPSNATELDLSGTGVSDLTGIMDLTALQSVRLASNGLTNIYPFQYSECWKTLTYLDLSDNAISDITPLAALTNLETLILTDNCIASVQALMALTNLRTLYISGNGLTEAQITELELALTNCTIYADEPIIIG